MEQAIIWSILYGLPVSAILLGVGGVLFAARMKNKWSLVLAIGTSVEAITLLIQRFMPVHYARLNEAGEVIASSPMSLIRHLSNFTAPVGIIIIAIGLLWGAMSSRPKDGA